MDLFKDWLIDLGIRSDGYMSYQVFQSALDAMAYFGEIDPKTIAWL